MTFTAFYIFRTALDSAEDNHPIWTIAKFFESLTADQRLTIFMDMAVRGWERRDRIFLPCGLVWERRLSEDGTAWEIADITAQFFP